MSKLKEIACIALDHEDSILVLATADYVRLEVKSCVTLDFDLTSKEQFLELEAALAEAKKVAGWDPSIEEQELRSGHEVALHIKRRSGRRRKQKLYEDEIV